MRLPRTVTWLLAAGLALFLAASLALAYLVRATPMLRDRVVAALNGRFNSQVQLASLQVDPYPDPGVSGSGLELRLNGRTDIPPLITIRSFSGTAGLTGLLSTPVRLNTVTLEALNIQVPPGGFSKSQIPNAKSHLPGNSQTGSRTWDLGFGIWDLGSANGRSLIIDRIEAAPVWLELASRNPLKPPRVFDIHRLVMTDFRPDSPARFQASLTNAIPTGEIETEGEFGPYLATDPERTAIRGKYALERAQLDDIRGLGGTLSSSGSYDGVLERLTVRGETRSTDFAIDVSHQPVSLTTTFTAVVDATNGDTILEQVRATLIDTVINAKGAVVRARDVKGRHVSMDVTIADGRLADVLTLAMRPGKPPLTGEVDVDARLLIPAGDQRVIDRMELEGEFALSQARFTSFNVQKRINVLSQRARGNDGDDEAESVVSNLVGAFAMRNGAIRFPALAFSVPGARVELTGTYRLRNETMNFRGHLLLDVSLADTTSGLRAIAARLVQPFFRRPGGGSRIPIRITGSRARPQFGVDLRRAFLPG